MKMLGLRTKLIVAIAFPIALLAAFFAFFVPDAQERTADEALELRAVNYSQLLARLLEPYVSTGTGDIDKALGAVQGDPDLSYVAVVSGDKVVARYRSAKYREGSEALQTTREVVVAKAEALIHVGTAIFKDAANAEPEYVGTLTVGFSRESIVAARRSSTGTAVVVSLIMLAVGCLFAWLFSGTMAKPLRLTSQRLTTVAEDLVSAARAREASAAEEAAAVEQTRRTMDMLLSSAQKIADSASVVLGNAERTLDGNREISDRIHQLNRHAEKVAEILATIMQIADRTDLLALNAAIEGTKAGEAGKGFGLVAKEMRRLAENVMDSVAGIRRLMKDVRDASQAAVDASQHGTDFSEETTRSVREIALVTQQQRKATEQVSRSMDDMTELLNHAMVDIKQTTRSASALSDLASGLAALIRAAAANGQLGGGGPGGDRDAESALRG